ncbi:cyclin-dependent kinase inhibitor 4-like [Abrus precatorius]|uniref:Cyclin-dependent kinase inhibitor 4-like n=1 Tax=Abrus precatorius TaxID=3816 RepID=A0A8B8K340_ABRPR|nr:cyclin-dependent kinase inhibitor 4-like [Abrus precatorius]
MGKCMRKSKAGGDVAVMEVSTSSPIIGVRTRAMTLALQNSHPYLQLRSRRLQKLLSPPIKKTAAAAPRVANQNVDPFFAETTLLVETKDRSTRESTPCSLLRDSNAVDTQNIHELIQRNIPTAYEMDEFFAFAEKQQQTIFMDKYNFDIVNDIPLPGRFEWVQVHN